MSTENSSAGAALHARILIAVTRELGLASPPLGSHDHDSLAIKLQRLVDSLRVDRTVLFSDGLRRALQEICYECDNGGDGLDRSWRHEVYMAGNDGLQNESDTHLLERVVTGATFDSLGAGKSSVEPPHEHGAELLDVLNGTAGVAICRRLLAEDPNGMAIEFLREVAMEMEGRTLSAYADLLESVDRPSGA